MKTKHRGARAERLSAAAHKAWETRRRKQRKPAQPTLTLHDSGGMAVEFETNPDRVFQAKVRAKAAAEIVKPVDRLGMTTKMVDQLTELIIVETRGDLTEAIILWRTIVGETFNRLKEKLKASMSGARTVK